MHGKSHRQHQQRSAERCLVEPGCAHECRGEQAAGGGCARADRQLDQRARRSATHSAKGRENTPFTSHREGVQQRRETGAQPPGEPLPRLRGAAHSKGARAARAPFLGARQGRRMRPHDVELVLVREAMQVADEHTTQRVTVVDSTGSRVGIRQCGRRGPGRHTKDHARRVDALHETRTDPTYLDLAPLAPDQVAGQQVGPVLKMKYVDPRAQPLVTIEFDAQRPVVALIEQERGRRQSGLGPADRRHRCVGQRLSV